MYIRLTLSPRETLLSGCILKYSVVVCSRYVRRNGSRRFLRLLPLFLNLRTRGKVSIRSTIGERARLQKCMLGFANKIRYWAWLPVINVLSQCISLPLAFASIFLFLLLCLCLGSKARGGVVAQSGIMIKSSSSAPFWRHLQDHFDLLYILRTTVIRRTKSSYTTTT